MTRAVFFTSAAASVFATAGRAGGAGGALQLVRAAARPAPLSRGAACERGTCPRRAQGICAGRLPLWRLLTANLVFASTGAQCRNAFRGVASRR